MKWLAAARLGMRWPQVMSTPTGRSETRRLIWPSSCLRLLFTSTRLANGRPMPKVLKMWRFVMLFLLFVLGSRSRFTKLLGLLIAGDVLDANDILATIQRQRHSEGRLAYHCLEQLVGRLRRFRECTCLTRFNVLGRSRGAPCAGHTPQTVVASKLPRLMSL